MSPEEASSNFTEAVKEIKALSEYGTSYSKLICSQNQIFQGISHWGQTCTGENLGQQNYAIPCGFYLLTQ